MEREDLKSLAEKILNGEASDEEIAHYISWFNSYQDPLTVIEHADEKKAAIYAGIENSISRPRNNIRLMLRVAAAAVVIFALTITTYSLLQKKSNIPTTMVLAERDIKPGGNRATLTLSNGKQIVLDDAKSGRIAEEQGIGIRKNKNGQVVYDLSTAATGGVSHPMNTISTPRGGQYEVILPDGTKVWLNAASSLTFPALFSGNERVVELTGEGYFEVTKDKAHPFRVKCQKQQIEVLGTHFDINAYTDEKAVKTTLLEGAVRVVSGSKEAMLIPGQQSLVTSVKNTTQIAVDQSVNLNQVVAWKNGLFSFNETDIPTLMRQISRWYDVDIVYEGKIPEDKFTGNLSRSVNLSNVFRLLQFTGIDFKIEGRKVIIR
ncbi:FecR family protein [Mucilaginibacter sabulilitoris]|uniref:FecR family protein n=1 Tax=Mucilaginibacter sabulilitoris TaxID=1173583 RepID=A0ABZ0TTF2_9SPHI|nr:FecR family protein [Mucilaginibacter sabulilitoris]WPU94730.1 FecR family protein [Mucilaginibacter sabulilitoris]